MSLLSTVALEIWLHFYPLFCTAILSVMASNYVINYQQEIQLFNPFSPAAVVCPYLS